jgi:hypothetical protein
MLPIFNRQNIEYGLEEEERRRASAARARREELLYGPESGRMWEQAANPNSPLGQLLSGQGEGADRDQWMDEEYANMGQNIAPYIENLGRFTPTRLQTDAARGMLTVGSPLEGFWV